MTDDELCQWIDQFIAYTALIAPSPHTARTYRTILYAFRTWATHRIGAPATTLDYPTLHAYVAYLATDRVRLQATRGHQREAVGRAQQPVDTRRTMTTRALGGDTPAKLSPRTIRNYVSVLVHWITWLVETGKLVPLQTSDGDALPPKMLRQYLEQRLSRPAANEAPRMPLVMDRLPAYYHRQLTAYLDTQGLPAGDAPAAQRAYLNLLRNRALIAVLFASGGRLSEVLSLTTAQVRRRSSIVRSTTITGKGNKARAIRFDPIAREWIAAYLDARPAAYSAATSLFLSHGPRANGKRLSTVSAWRIVKEAAVWLASERDHAGAEQDEIDALLRLSPHSLRHFFAQGLLDNEVSYGEIARLLGHSSTAVTERVYARHSEAHVLEVAEQKAPRPKLE